MYKRKRMQFIQIQYRQNTNQNSIVSFPKKISEKEADALALAIKTWGSVLRFSASENGFVKFELEVPSDGEYKLFLSYFKGPDCSAFQVNQRQIPIKKLIKGYSEEDTFIEKDYIGKFFIKEGTNTLTVILNENSGQANKKDFVLYRIYLEK